ncbi:MAG: DUF488 family protein [Alphaproteobacteria bacterium]|nr:DUF488 family protein [Alphaproteobacteria bacterium]
MIWTIGYERAGQAELVAALRAAGIEVLADVRELPNSRRAGFAKRQLSASLEEAGIGYTHIKALGTPRAGRDASKRGDLATFRAIYEIAIAQPEAQLALRALKDMAQSKRVCLLCLEHDWRVCHRARICDALAEHGVQATHLVPI